MQRLFLLILLIFLLISPMYGKNKKPSLKGSRESQQRQNEEANKEDLSRIKNDDQLENMKQLRLLVPLPTNQYIQIDSRLKNEFTWCRPWTRNFLITLSKDFHKNFPKSKNKIKINSAVRTIEYQNELRGRNKNAIEAAGPLASSHSTGATIDIAKLDLSRGELSWMRKYLLRLEGRKAIEATEEQYQAVFHIMVYAPHKK